METTYLLHHTRDSNVKSVSPSQECSLLSQLPSRPTFGSESHPSLASINVIRLLRLRETDKEMWDRVDLLMDHVEEIVQEERLREMWDGSVVKMLTQDIPQSGFSRQDVLRAVGLLHTNGVSLGARFGYSLYPTFSFISHSCLCNSRYQIHPDRHRISLAHV